MNYNTLDYGFVQKVINRKVRRNIVWAEYDLQWIPFNKKIDFALNRLKQISFFQIKGDYFILGRIRSGSENTQKESDFQLFAYKKL